MLTVRFGVVGCGWSTCVGIQLSSLIENSVNVEYEFLIIVSVITTYCIYMADAMDM